ncbi:MAG: HAD-IIB family hydrolase [Gammaproteobacteria bacterium]|nr:HAD-IIB family hydrolase [Gammaproteobacteria bacterium]
MPSILLCCDLDRTVLPNGNANESPGVRDLFASVIKEANIILAYVSGRDLHLLQQAIADYHIPTPAYAIGDVGTTLYQITDNQWQAQTDWSDHIGVDWQQHDAAALQEYLDDLPYLTLQEPEKQNIHKLSYYVNLSTPEQTAVREVRQHLDEHRIKANIIYSIDEIADCGLIDILPQRASKYHAIEFLIDRLGLSKEDTVFAGDSGNDLPVLISDIPAVLVNNALGSIKNNARRIADKNGLAPQLYLARGGFFGLNGNYCAGILEGLVHFHPELRPLIANYARSSG